MPALIQRISNNKHLDFILIQLVFFVLLVLSIVFFKERMIFTDTAYYTTELLTKETIIMPTNRFIVFYTQAIALLAIKLGLSLKMIMIVFSSSLLLFPILFSYITYFKFKDVATTYALLFFYLVSNVWLFFYPISEFQTGLALLLLLNSYNKYYFVSTSKNPWVFSMVNIILLVHIIFSHPLSIVVVLGWWAWALVFNESFRKKLFILPALIAALCYFIKEKFFRAMVGSYDYEGHRKEGLAYFNEPLRTWFDNNLSNMFLKAWLDHYFLTIAFILLVLVVLVYHRKWVQTIVFSGLVLGFWILITVNFKHWPFNEYLEHMYQPVTFVLAITFGFVLIKYCKRMWLRLSLVGIFSLFIILKIVHVKDHYANRLAWFDNKMKYAKDQNAKLAILSLDEQELLNYDQCWASASETLLLSSLKSKDSSMVLKFVPKDKDVSSIIVDTPLVQPKYFGILSSDRFIDLRQ